MFKMSVFGVEVELNEGPDGNSWDLCEHFREEAERVLPELGEKVPARPLSKVEQGVLEDWQDDAFDSSGPDWIDEGIFELLLIQAR